MLKTLSEKADPENAALLIIDMQNDFCHTEGAFSRKGYDVGNVQDVIPRIAKLLSEAHSFGVPVIFVKSSYSTDANWYLSEVWLEQKMKNKTNLYVDGPALKPDTWGWQLVDGIKPGPDDAVITKHRYNAFLGTELDLVLRSKGVKSVILTGVATNVCVETTARDAYLRDYYVLFTSDCTASYDLGAHDATLFNIGRYFGEVVSSDAIIKSWNDGVRTRDLAAAPTV